MAATKEYPILPFASASAWEGWLAAHHAGADGVWIKMAKKASGTASVTHDEALDVALCYGWIDGQKGSYDERAWVQKFTPRTKRSPWSEINRGHVARLIEQGRMRPAGLAEVERAKADGRWENAYGSQSMMQVPADLQAVLDADPAVAAAFAGLSKTNRYAILYRLHDAKRPETRAKRLADFVERLREGWTPYPQGRQATGQG